MTRDTTKNEVFVNTRSKFEEISKAARTYLKDIKKNLETIKTNNELIKSVLEEVKNKNTEAKTGTFLSNQKDRSNPNQK